MQPISFERHRFRLSVIMDAASSHALSTRSFALGGVFCQADVLPSCLTGITVEFGRLR